MLGPAVQVNDAVIRACQERNEFGGLSFALYREATELVWTTCDTYYEAGRIHHNPQPSSVPGSPKPDFKAHGISPEIVIGR